MGTENKKRRLTAAVAALFSAAISLLAQGQPEQRDSLLRLISASYIEQAEEGDDFVRRAVDATFLHNGTYLIADSSVWSQNTNIINCMGNVRLLQGDTELTSDKLDYLVDEDLAQFRGVLVQLRDKQENMLRTRILDYNTKDSVAVFRGGAAMRSSDGQIIESDEGHYFNARSFFSFEGNVNMYTDSVFVRADSLHYLSDVNKAEFVSPIDFWKDDNMLHASGGWYKRPDNVFFFSGDVHGLTRDQESWSDTLFFYRATNDVLMRGRVQIQDSTRSTAAVSRYLFYKDTLSQVTLRDNAAVAVWEENESSRADTTYFGADTLVYNTLRRCDISAGELSSAAERLKTINGDPVAEFRRRAAEQAAKAKEDAAKQNGANNIPKASRAGRAKNPGDIAPTSGVPPLPPDAGMGAAPLDSSAVTGGISPKDSLAANQDALAAAADSLSSAPPPPDTSRVGFLTGLGNVKLFRRDIQVRCDSVRFNELDSIARFYKDPIIWNEGRRQYSSDSLFVLVKSWGADRASLMSNAFIAVDEDSLHFDQIKSSEVMAYFDKETQLRRFDALGGVTALFYLKENETLATVNKVEARMLSADLKDGEVDRIYYFDNPKNDAYPVAQMAEVDRTLKGFVWKPELRPKSKSDITKLELRSSRRFEMRSRPRTTFPYTEVYYPGYMSSVYAAIDSIRTHKNAPHTEALQVTDSLSAAIDSAAIDSAAVDIAAIDSVSKEDIKIEPDSVAVKGGDDSPAVSAADSTSVAAPQQEEQYMSKAELRRALRKARRDARWAELDARDAARAAAREKKREERRLRKEARRAARIAKEEAKDAALLQKYIEYYKKQKERDERKQKSKPARERTSGVETGGSVQTPSES